MKKRIFSGLLALCMALALLPAPARAVEADSPAAEVTINGGAPTEYETFQAAWEAAVGTLNAPQTQPALVKLLKNVNAGDFPTFEGKPTWFATQADSNQRITVDLNGHTMDQGFRAYSSGNNNSSIFTISGGSSLTLKDSAGGGKLTGAGAGAVRVSGAFTLESGEISGNFSNSNAGVLVWSGATFTMTGGHICNNVADNTGGGVTVSGSFIMTGGEITGNQAPYGAGILGAGDITLSGDVKISGNTKDDSTPLNLYLSTQGLIIKVSGALGSNTRIGVSPDPNYPPTAGRPITVAEPTGSYTITEDDFSKFSSDDDQYELVLDSGLILLKVKDAAPSHTHAWATAWTNNTTHHWHECQGTGTCDITDDSGKDGYAGHNKTYDKDDSQHWEKCSDCGWTDTNKANHVYDDDQDTACNDCGYTRTLTPGPGDSSTQGKVETSGGAPAVTTDTEVLKGLAGQPNAGETITVKLTVAKKEESDADGADAIKTEASGKTVEFLDLSLVKTVTSSGSSTDTEIHDTGDKVLELVVPYDFTGKKDVTVYRYHGGAAAALTKADTGADGTFKLGSGSVTIYASKFSTYAIGYTVKPKPPVTGGYIPTTYAVGLPASTPGGKLTAFPGSASAGVTVTLTLSPDEGYGAGGVTVTGQDGKTVAVTGQGGGKYTFTMPSGNVTVTAAFQKIMDGYKDCPRDSACPVRRFTDADPAAWYHDALHYCVEGGLMNGYGNGLFGPDDSLSRAQFAQILFNREGRPVVNYLMQFEDVPNGAWYTEAVRWAAAQHIAEDRGDGRFGPSDSISREELAVMLWRYAGSPPAADKELHFTDADKASGYAAQALCWAVERGIISGKAGGILDPGGSATRAEAAQMLKSFAEQAQ